MKNSMKLFGTALAFCAVLTSAVCALPTAEYVEGAGEVNAAYAYEAQTAQVLVAENIIAAWEFDEEDSSIHFVSTERTGYPAGSVSREFKSESLDGETVKYVSVTPHAEGSVADGLCPNVYFKPTDDANSYYSFTATDTSAIDRIEMRVRLAKSNEMTLELTADTTIQFQGSYRMLANKTVTKEQANASEWVTLQVKPGEFLNAPANNILNSFRFYVAPGLYEGWTLDVDYIRVYKKSDVQTFTAAVSVDGQTLSDASNSVYFDSGIFTFTFDKAPGVEAAKFTATVLNDTANNFEANGTRVSADGLVYTVYARRDLRGKTVAFNDITTSERAYKLGKTAVFAKSEKEGNNVFVNGSFQNPYLTKWQNWGSSNYTTEISDGGMKVTFGESNGNFSLFAYNHGDAAGLEKGAKYLLSINVTFPSENQPSALGTNKIDLYPYILTNSSVEFRANSGKYFEKWSKPAKYPTVNDNLNGNSIILNYPDRNDTVQSVARIFDTSDAAVTEAFCKAPYIFLAPYCGTKSISELAGLNFVINSVSAKKLFSVSFDANGGTGSAPENALYACGESFRFPENTYTVADKAFGGWECDGTVYRPGDTFVPTVSGDNKLVLKAVWNEKNAPEMQGSATRTDRGIRFFAHISSSRISEAKEYGFIATTEIVKNKLAAAGKNTELSFKNSDIENLYRKGVVFDSNTNIVYEHNSEYDVIAATVTGILENKKDAKVFIRSYITFDGKLYFYGEEKSASVSELEE